MKKPVLFNVTAHISNSIALLFIILVIANSMGHTVKLDNLTFSLASLISIGAKGDHQAICLLLALIGLASFGYYFIAGYPYSFYEPDIKEKFKQEKSIIKRSTNKIMLYLSWLLPYHAGPRVCLLICSIIFISQIFNNMHDGAMAAKLFMNLVLIIYVIILYTNLIKSIISKYRKSK